LDVAAIPHSAGSLLPDHPSPPALDPATHYLGEPDATLAYVLTLDAINFGSGYFPHLTKRPGYSGYFTVAASLKDHFEQHGPLSAADLAALSFADCARMFGQSLEGPAGELMGLFATALNDLGRLVVARFEGSFRGLVDAAQGSAEQLVGVLAQMPFYRDVHAYNGFHVPFYKRAQLTAADLATAGAACFQDLDRLTIFADNLVPHVLRVDGLLEYDPHLIARIEREELIPAGSPEEVEIRACALHAVELLAGQLRQRGRSVTAMQLDYLLWNRGQQPQYKAVPRHRTRSVFY
jgi:hypothetical protein